MLRWLFEVFDCELTNKGRLYWGSDCWLNFVEPVTKTSNVLTYCRKLGSVGFWEINFDAQYCEFCIFLQNL